MKNADKSIVRVETLINNDRMKASDNFTDLLTVDLCRVFDDYFEHKDLPIVGVSKNGNKISVAVTLTASGIKAFKRLPKDGGA